ncbi:hypothetical protein AAMO2058_001640000 [Amorphochlora amoebiformis]|uniref:Cytochrome b5 heme-binding domain-containing protein n=1 Tax=Amorphochlora amoebiformis TaxID=1561963 RepID=A0A7S0DM84_9EUKA
MAREEKTFSVEEVSKHDGKSSPEIWVTFDNQVYDITKFAQEHPGGSVIMDAAGGPIEPYWAYWAYHLRCPKPKEFLEKYKIGKLDKSETESVTAVESDLYETDPKRGSELRAYTVRPFSCETNPSFLARSSITPAGSLYVRNHAPVPEVEKEGYGLQIEGLDGTSKEIKLSKIGSKRATLTSILQCAGNRGGEMEEIKDTAFSGTPYTGIGIGMIGNAEWGGYWLSDILKTSIPNLDTLIENDTESKLHIIFEGADGYESSAPLKRAVEKKWGAMLADTINGGPLPPDHGFPLRAFFPGLAGCRSVKWVTKIRVSSEESTSPWNKYYYKHADGKSITTMPLTSMILDLTPSENAEYNLKGIAWGGGSGLGVSKVEISADSGLTWKRADLQKHPKNPENVGKFSWQPWEAQLTTNEIKGDHVMCRAFDTQGHGQPENPWNPKGYLYNGWHKKRLPSKHSP